MSLERVPKSDKFHSNDQLLKWHYRTLADIVDYVVTRIDNLAEVSPVLHQIGEAHAPYYNYNVRSDQLIQTILFMRPSIKIEYVPDYNSDVRLDLISIQHVLVSRCQTNLFSPS